MKVTLVGTNVELAQVRSSAADEGADGGPSPEAIAAAYARISRSPLSVAELRAEARADVARARRSNEQIVFQMGHSSIAEHAVFNFDLEGISRLAIEAVEWTRLASFTERSQRYVALSEEAVIPDEVAASPEAIAIFRQATSELRQGYVEVAAGLREHLRRALPEGAAPERQLLRELATAALEDSRYLLPLAMPGQLGMTINARSLAAMCRRLQASPWGEVRRLGAELVTLARRVTPSLVRYTDPGPLDELAIPPSLLPGDGREPWLARPVGAGAASVELLDWSREPDRLLELAAAFSGRHRSAADLVGSFLGQATVHDSAPRSFELLDLLFCVRCSAACFGQLKRHRLATILPGPYEPGLGAVVPPAVRAAGLEDSFLGLLGALPPRLAALDRLGLGVARSYLLVNGHTRRCLVKMNLRELYHFSRLRMDGHAQWEIRAAATEMCRLAQAALGESAAMLCGKDRFDETRGRLVNP